ncbi:protein involved in polysaccharide export, contains SLBB domain of the beta-grasp fold [Ekhidna lutea]|uniref:Protein involved in polysaccharide export, contains SLBB domain of the beta-grasp fold n=1 Tax=Ekhidna lutea TaxID=447679 RepID=A0A239FFD9_EKHLU|nr:SLBB domain-containing protein [Ekhidna lutea]SNS55639.1 protein involved in polysaccharide export, contains SLBB domain of the beta-grasp fold [Ekhidna lutea]
MKLLKYCLIVFSISFGNLVNAQGLDSDLKSIEIDQLSDGQIQQFLDKAKESGMTLDQLEIVAKQRGMSSIQLSKLRSRIQEIQLKTSTPANQIEHSGDRLRDQPREKDYNAFESLNPSNSTRKSKKLKLFASDIFTSVKPSFEPLLNIPTPVDYVLGPGDEIIIDVFGASEVTYQQIISPDGNILIEGVGPIPLANIDIEMAKNRILNRLSIIFSGLKGRNPNTFLQLSLGKVRSIKVNVVGNVSQPGTYTLSSLSTLFNALYNAGGPSANGSMREIELHRENSIVATLDVYKYLFEGKSDQNIQLRDGDIVIVKPYLNRAKLAGSIKNPAIYEIRNDETLADLIRMAGGFDELAFKDYLTIDRVGDVEKKLATIKQEDYQKEALHNGDSIFVSPILSTYSNRIKIEGAINRPGYYELTSQLTLAGLIAKSQGLREDAYLKRGNIVRLNQNLTLQNISFDVQLVMDGEQDIVLSPEDLVIIPSIFDVEEKKVITISGQVRKPGEFPFIDNMTVEDLIGLSGGLLEDASTTKIEVARRLSDTQDLSKSSQVFTFKINKDLSINEEASHFILKPFDLVLVKSTPYVRKHKIIRIEGEVNFPGLYTLETHEDRLSDAIKRAGGLTDYGYPEGAILIRKTEYFQSKVEERAIKALVEKRRKELESRYAGQEDSYQFIQQQLADYEKEVTENIKKGKTTSELEARIFRTQQLRMLFSRDSISGFNEIIEQEAIGIELNDALNKPGSEFDLILRDGDLISVPKKLETVRVQGEVLYPNTVRYSKGSGFKSYISSSGGFSSNAKIGKSYVVYANGSAKRTKNILFFRKFPPIKPGADIVVPKKQIRRKLNVQEVLGVTSSLATIALIIDRLSN